MSEFIKHVAGEFNEADLTQSCIMCGEEIENYQGASWPSGQEPPKGWAAGVIYRKKGFPTVTQTTEPKKFKACS